MAMLLLVLGVLVHRVEGICIKKYNSRHSKGGFIFTALISLFSMMFFVITDKDGLSFPTEMIPYGIISGILYCMATFLTYVAFGCGSYAMSSLILSYALLFSIGYGIFFLGEPTSVYTYIGLVIMLVSLYLVKGNKKDGETAAFSLKWLICISLSVVGSGMFGVISRMQQIRFDDACTNEFMIVSLALSFVVLLVIGIVKDGKDLGCIIKNGGIYACAAGLANGATNLLSLVVNTMMPLSIASPTRAGVKIVMSYAIAKLMFKEKFSKRQVLGVLLGAAALVLLNIK